MLRKTGFTRKNNSKSSIIANIEYGWIRIIECYTKASKKLFFLLLGLLTFQEFIDHA